MFSKGIKRVKGPVKPRCLPITIDDLTDIQCSLDLSARDHMMLWAACFLGFFGFLHVGEFTVNALFQPSIHMTVSKLQADLLVNPTCFKVHIKCSKQILFTCPVGHTEGSVFLFRALGRYLAPVVRR